jgi:hypothetical protein
MTGALSRPDENTSLLTGRQAKPCKAGFVCVVRYKSLY